MCGMVFAWGWGGAMASRWSDALSCYVLPRRSGVRINRISRKLIKNLKPTNSEFAKAITAGRYCANQVKTKEARTLKGVKVRIGGSHSDYGQVASRSDQTQAVAQAVSAAASRLETSVPRCDQNAPIVCILAPCDQDSIQIKIV